MINSDNKTNTKQVSLFDLVEEEKKDAVKEPEIAYTQTNENQEVVTEINNLNLDNLRPIDALNELYKLKDLIK